jgi:hypothetical protein
MSEGEPEQEAVSDHALLRRILIDTIPTLKGTSGGQLSPGKFSKVQQTAVRQKTKQKLYDRLLHILVSSRRSKISVGMALGH